MRLLDITKFNTDFDILSQAKLDIENKWKKEKLIAEHQPFTDFIKHVNVSKYILMFDDETAIPFNFILTDNQSYLFYCGTGNERIDVRATNYIVGIIDSLDYNIYGLSEVTTTDLMINDKVMPDTPYFIIDRKNYIFDKSNM